MITPPYLCCCQLFTALSEAIGSARFSTDARGDGPASSGTRSMWMSNTPVSPVLSMRCRSKYGEICAAKNVMVTLYMTKPQIVPHIWAWGFSGERSGVGLFGSEVTQLPFFAG